VTLVQRVLNVNRQLSSTGWSSYLNLPVLLLSLSDLTFTTPRWTAQETQ
jgi:hypothetical protein